jgi:hypothetical protein
MWSSVITKRGDVAAPWLGHSWSTQIEAHHIARTRASQACEDGGVESDDDGETVEGSRLEESVEEPDDTGGFDRWRKESALGSVGTGVARGLHAVFGRPVDEVVVVASVPGDPPDASERLRVILDPDDPTKSVAVMPEPPAAPPSE